ncbi:MAG: CapA family protein [Lachnospiraceae bacterium]|nr:CapA family protein [Lachnospiraceae bacterium]
MRRTKIKTDNVEQLMEIVRSLQRGEEPTQESIRESAERVSKTDAPMSDEPMSDEPMSDEPMSDEPMSDEPMSDEPESDAQTGEKRTDTKADWDAEDDAFVRSLEETDARISARRERFTKEEEQSAGGRGLGGLWQKAAGYLESRRAQQESEEDDDYEDTEEEALPLDDTEAPKAEADQRAEADGTEMQTDAEAQSGGVIQSLVTGIKNRKKRIRRSREKLEDANDADDDIEETPTEQKKQPEREAASSEEGQENAKENEAEPQSESARPVSSRPWKGILPKGKGTRYPEHLSRNTGYGETRSGLLRRDSILRDLDEDEEEPKEELPVEPESQNVFERITGNATEAASPKQDEQRQPEDTTDTTKAASPKQDEQRQLKDTTDTAQVTSSEQAEQSESAEQPQPEQTTDTPEDAASIKITNAKKRRRKTAAEKEEELRKGFAPQKRTAADMLLAARECVQDGIEALRDKGISRREMAMITAAAVFVLLLVVLIFQAVGGSIASRRKSENVTADSGLRITVEDEPENWCSSYPVQLKLSVTDATLQSVQVNGTGYTPDASGLITVGANTDILEVEVATDQGTRSARVEIPKLDGEPPVVHASLQKDRIELTAADARSSVRALYYAVGPETESELVPQYQKYTEPISYTEGMLYRFYAEDAAGNRSTPVVTNMKTAESLTVSPETLALYPGETAALTVKVEPEYALLENLSYESQNPDLLSVSDGGVVTALANGTGTVRVTADGVSAAICTAEVSESRTVTVSAVGDCTLGTDESFNTSTSFNAYEAMNGTSYFFQNVRSILEADDATFANFEGTLTTETARESKEYAFKGDPSYTQILTDGSIDVVTLANNHSSDYGAKSLTDTEEALDAAGIDYCIGDKIAVKEVNGIPTAFIGIYVLNDGMAREEQVKQTIAAAKQQGAKLVIVAFHWGTEKAAEPDETQKSLAHTAIDCGADLVVGHHPHVLQAIEYYKGKYIAYSLGNFCFGGNSAPSDMDTMIFQQTFTIEKGEVQAAAAATVVPCSISSTAGYNDYQPTPTEGDASASVIDRLNTMSANYGVTVNADGTVTASGTQ